MDDIGSIDTVILDLDGTLVDSAYVHVSCWRAAFRDVGLEPASYLIHRAIGMGGDRLVAAVTSDAVERSLGDEIRRRHAHHLDERFHEVTPFAGAEQLLTTIRERRLQLALASSSDRSLTDRLLGARPRQRSFRPHRFGRRRRAQQASRRPGRGGDRAGRRHSGRGGRRCRVGHGVSAAGRLRFAGSAVWRIRRRGVARCRSRPHLCRRRRVGRTTCPTLCRRLPVE